MVALITYSPNDLGFNSTGTNENINNFIGVIGSYFSSLVITFIGISSYFIPLLFFILGLILITSEKSIKSYRELIILRTVSFIMILITTCVITSVHLSIPWMPEGAGGILGLAIASFLLNNFSIIGTTLLMLSIWFCFIPIFIGFSWITVIEAIGRSVIKLFSLIIEASKKVLLVTKDISRKVEIKNTLKKSNVKKEIDKQTDLAKILILKQPISHILQKQNQKLKN